MTKIMLIEVDHCAFCPFMFCSHGASVNGISYSCKHPKMDHVPVEDKTLDLFTAIADDVPIWCPLDNKY